MAGRDASVATVGSVRPLTVLPTLGEPTETNRLNRG